MEALDIEIIAESMGIDICNFSFRECKAASFEEGWIAIDLNKFECSAELRVTLGHEIAHIVRGAFYSADTPKALIDLIERNVERWLIHQLVPLDSLKNAIRHGIIEFYELADYFFVTEEFIRKAFAYYHDARGEI